MTMEDNRGPGWRSRYEPHETTLVMRMLADDRSQSDIAERLGRSPKSVQRHIDSLRRDGTIPAYSPRRRMLEVHQAVSMGGAPITLRDDDKLVSAVRKLGGFPRAQVVGGRTFWLTDDNRQWQYGVAG